MGKGSLTFVTGICTFLLVGSSTFAAPTLSNEAPFIDIEERPNLTEGDMILAPGGDAFLKNGMIDERYRWPNATVVYELDPLFTDEDIKKIPFAWEEIANETCIKFRPRENNETDYTFITKGAVGSGCSSTVGRAGGRQSQNLEAPSCIDRHGSLVHEMLHTIGFRHEQSRSDRDDYVTEVFDKIEPGKENNFIKYNESQVTGFGAPYDYGCILHYSPYGFSSDGNATIVPKIPGVNIVQRVRISQIDAGKVILMYNCPVDQ